LELIDIGSIHDPCPCGSSKIYKIAISEKSKKPTSSDEGIIFMII